MLKEKIKELENKIENFNLLNERLNHLIKQEHCNSKLVSELQQQYLKLYGDICLINRDLKKYINKENK